MNDEVKTSSHHVAWSDRIGLNKQWAKDIQICSDYFGTPQYRLMVRRWKNNIPNIKNGIQFKYLIAKGKGGLCWAFPHVSGLTGHTREKR